MVPVRCTDADGNGGGEDDDSADNEDDFKMQVVSGTMTVFICRQSPRT